MEISQRSMGSFKLRVEDISMINVLGAKDSTLVRNASILSSADGDSKNC